MLRTVFLPVRASIGSAKAGFVVGRLLGYRRLFVFGVGVGVGLLLAPMTGRQLRDRVAALVESRRPPGDDEVAERVRFELSHSPRTWHLPQPQVDVVNGTAVLRGEAPHSEGRAELERAASAVTGVVGVDNHVEVTRPTGGNGHQTG